ncbi:MAG: hypothetical protein IIX19_04315 [Alistipes sp.]|nr:hypothetical protein [Alistipes sp.]
MGYHRRFSKTIYVHYSGSVSYPASNSGGHVSYSGTTSENVEVDIYVDTDPFDHSVTHCNSNISALNASVVTMSAAQVAAINENAKKIGSTIVKGFFSTVSSEISQQIAELRSSVDATLLRLNELSKQCANKQRQMQSDYTRITSRYLKIFEELDKECQNRIFEIDRPAFIFKRTTDQTAERATCNDLVTTAAVAGGENCAAEARIGASHTKRRAMEALGRANDYLTLQRKTDSILAQSAFERDAQGTYYAPVCYVETLDDQKIDRQVYRANELSLDNNALIEEIRNKELRCDDPTQLHSSFNQVIGTQYAHATGHDARVRDYITKLFKSNINK